MLQIRDQLVSLSEAAGVMIALYDGFDRLRYANPAFRETFHLDPEEEPFWADIMRRNHTLRHATRIASPDFEAWLLETQSRRGRLPFRSYETDLHDGRWLLMTETVQPDGWMMCVASDITALSPDQRELRQDRDTAVKASHTDELTGVSNRRYVMQRLEDMVRGIEMGAAEAGCLCLLDLDHFKSINDRYGHAAGDRILQDFARRVSGTVRRNDCFGRVGGEEFMVVLSGTRIGEAELLVERMMSTIRAVRPAASDLPCGYGFSAGIAECISGESASDLYVRADRALYAAKAGGRDCIRVDQTESVRKAPAA